MKSRISRRSFLQLASVGAGGLIILPACKDLKLISHWQFFTDDEATLLESLIEQIIPADEWPGAKDAGVARFIDIQLTGPYTRFRETYRKGLKAVSESSRELYSKSFTELTFDQQTLFLKNMESGKMSQDGKSLWANNLDRIFFSLLRDHTMQGFYGSPRHGGNKDYVSYRMIGLDYPLIIGQNRYKKKL